MITEKTNSRNPLVVLIRYFWRFADSSDRRRIILYVSMFFLSNLFDFFPPLIIAKVLNIVQTSGLTSDNYLTIIMWLGINVLSTVGFWMFHGPARILEKKTAFRIEAAYKKFLLDGTLHLPASWHTNHHSGDTIDKINNASRGLFNFSQRIYLLIQIILRFTGAYLALIYFNLNSSYIVLIFCILSFYVVVKMDKKIIPMYKRLNRYQNKISAKIFDIISNISTVIILRIEKPVLKLIRKKIDEPFDLYDKTSKLNEFKWFLAGMFFVLMIFFVMGSYVLVSVKTGAVIMVGTLSVLFNYTGRIGSLFSAFTQRYSDFVIWRTNISNVEEISDDFIPKPKKRKSVLTRDWKQINVANLQFKYDDVKSKDLHLDNISFSLGRKERVAFIGASGSGKTTALKIIRELYPVKHLDMMIDGRVINGGFDTISETIALIPQDPEIFSTTIRENITLGLPISERKIKKYCDLARFTEVVKRLPRGLESSINERGVNLSGGEKQRLALARGLLACENKQIVLLDEPTSSVDPKNELEIYEDIFKIFKDKTIVSSIHRLHLLPLFDKIYLFHKGKIVGSGSFDELKKSSSLFKKMLDKYKQKKVKKRAK